MNRRTALSTLAGSALVAREALAQPPVVAQSAKPAARPILCAYSGNLAKIPYQELSGIVRAMGYEGLDLTVMPGGHVDPSLYMVDLDRAFQTIQSAGMDLPMVTTSFTSASQPYAYAILYVSAMLGAKFCRLGTWPPAPATAADPNAQAATMRAMMVRNDLTQLSVTGQRCKITPLLANHAGSYPGRSIPEAETMLNGIDRSAFGYCFDAAQAVIEARSAEGWVAALQSALPRLGAVAVSDVTIDSAGVVRPCPLGDGVIDWKKFFSLLAAARFRGPVSLHMDYETHSEVNAMTKDLAFARARVEEAWPL